MMKTKNQNLEIWIEENGSITMRGQLSKRERVKEVSDEVGGRRFCVGARTQIDGVVNKIVYVTLG
jgi:hypothetical protein